jgi:hypothetical protein
MRVWGGMIFRVAILVLLLVRSLDGPVGAAEPTITEVKARNQSILSHTPGADGIFVIQEQGDIQHLQSSLVCPAAFPNVAFWHAQIYSSPLGKGADVGCDYGRVDNAGHVLSKLTIFAVRAKDGTTLDQAFARYQQEVQDSTRNAEYLGPALRVDKDSAKGSEPFIPTDFRSAEYNLTLNGVRYRSQLLVALQYGWIIEVRATYSTVASGVNEQEVIEAGTQAARDIVSPVIAFQQATRSLTAAHERTDKMR